jgi:hypothetical protein
MADMTPGGDDLFGLKRAGAEAALRPGERLDAMRFPVTS